MFSNGARRRRGQPVEHDVRHVVVDDPQQLLVVSALVAAIHGPQKRTPVSSFGQQPARQRPRDIGDLARPRRSGQLGKAQPQVGLDNVRRQQRAIHVEDRDDLPLVLITLDAASCGFASRTARQCAQRRRDRRGVDLTDVVRPVDVGGVEAEPLDVVRMQQLMQGKRLCVAEVQLGLGIWAVKVEVAAQEVQPALLPVQ